MNRRHWISSVVVGVSVGLVVASLAAFGDWRQNPGGIFHNAQGTNWTVVVDTAISWFVPVSVLAFAAALLVLFLFARSR